jgi:hypothetical protein
VHTDADTGHLFPVFLLHFSAFDALLYHSVNFRAIFGAHKKPEKLFCLILIHPF